MSKAKTTKAAKKRSVLGIYRRIDELIKAKPAKVKKWMAKEVLPEDK
jgi:hypothetical protein